MSDIRQTLQLKADLRHRDMVVFEEAISRQPAKLLAAASGSSRASDVYLRAAIDAGWITAPKTETGKFEAETRHFVDGVNVDELPPWVVRFIGQRIEAAYNQAASIPKN